MSAPLYETSVIDVMGRDMRRKEMRRGEGDEIFSSSQQATRKVLSLFN